MVVQRDERATLLNIPDLDDSIPSGNNSDRDGESICSFALNPAEGSFTKEETIQALQQ